MGDEGKMYVSTEVLPVYKSMVLHADLIVPNQYEVEYDFLQLHMDNMNNVSILT